jgi:hypothetical protein
MNDAWASLIQTGIWIVGLAALLILGRHRLRTLTDALVQRIIQGAPIELGPVNIGAAPAAMRNTKEMSATAEGVDGAELPTDVESVLLERHYPAGLAEDVYLLHSALIVRPRTPTSPAVYRVRAWMEADSPKLLDEIQRVTYRLHDTFPQKVIATTARAQDFELWMNVYGEFTLVAHVERKGKPALWLARYLELPGRPPD